MLSTDEKTTDQYFNGNFKKHKFRPNFMLSENYKVRTEYCGYIEET